MSSEPMQRESSSSLSDRDHLPIEPMDARITSIQPGGGVCMRLELLWGRLRRTWLKTFRKSYVDRMRRLRVRDVAGYPHEVLDPRDEKFYQNQRESCWKPEDDPFHWRDRLPWVRVGLAELTISWLICGGAMLGLAQWWWPSACIPFGLGLFVTSFFRNPARSIPQDVGILVAPADGTIVGIEDERYNQYVDGPAVVISIFLSVFNVHINRSPMAARVIGITYTPGKFLNALRARSARENEQLALRLQESQAPYRRLIVRQIAGAIARRIVCCCKPGDRLRRGESFGMIKLGSRTELVFPKEANLEICVRKGQKVFAGATVLARYA